MSMFRKGQLDLLDHKKDQSTKRYDFYRLRGTPLPQWNRFFNKDIKGIKKLVVTSAIAMVA